MNGAIYVEGSKNSKLSKSEPVDSTYVSIQASCPKSCALMSEGCYGKTSFTGIVNSRLNKEAVSVSALDAARAEAFAIDESYNGGEVPGRSLRLHVIGDSRTVAGTKLINSAIKRWRMRGGNICWAYTHSWHNVSRDTWNQVSILASVDSVDQVDAAREQGYAPAIVVSEHKSDKTYLLDGSDVKWIPCPSQTRDVACLDCALCFNADRLFKDNFGIAFAAHGVQKNKIKKRLNIIK